MTVGAGGSAAAAAQESRQRAFDLEQQAAAERAKAGRYEVATETERRIVRRLSLLVPEGYQLLVDRRWPGSAKANVDCVLVGPAGAFIVDPKCWADVVVRPGRVTRGGKEAGDDLAALNRLAEVTRSRLADVGLPPSELHVLAVVAGRNDHPTLVGGVEVIGEHLLISRIVSTGNRLTATQVDAVMQACRVLFPPFDEPASASQLPAVTTQATADSLPRPRVVEDDALLDDNELHRAQIAAALRPPIEEWMTFLHPEQARLVQRAMTGPARIRGAAGTGKSVVGLHRAAWLARTRPNQMVLFTSYVRTVPAVARGLYARLSPETLCQVDFRTVHSLATEVMRDAGRAVPVDPQAARFEFNRAWSQVGSRGPLGRSQQVSDYWADEVSSVIKGRGLTEFDEYAQLRRVGRRYPVGPDLRQAVWDLYECYSQLLSRRGVADYDDLLIAAERTVGSSRVARRYATVIVDEVQDLTCVGARLVAQLAADGPEGLLLIGDGQQAIYPGGFTLAEAGIDVRGRSTVLRRNYRNTVEIVRVAQEVVGQDAFSDLDDSDELGQRDVEVTRHGPEPVRCVVADQRRLVAALVGAVDDARRLPNVATGDIAVLVTSNAEASRYLKVLRDNHIPAMSLADYTGTADDRVKVGTFHRAKGLEFKHVLLPGWDRGRGRSVKGQTEAAHREQRELERRQLFVAMTRARDGLWLGSLAGS